MIEQSSPEIELKDEAEQERPPYWRGRTKGRGTEQPLSAGPDPRPCQDLSDWLSAAPPLLPTGDRGTLEAVSFSIDLLTSLVAELADRLEVTVSILADTVEKAAVQLAAASERQALALELIAELRSDRASRG